MKAFIKTEALKLWNWRIDDDEIPAGIILYAIVVIGISSQIILHMDRVATWILFGLVGWAARGQWGTLRRADEDDA